MREIVTVNPFSCRMWRLHDRLDERVTEETCKAEIRSFLDHGQLVPALGRRLRENDEHEIELVYGARRLFVARHLNRPLLVEIRDLTDKEAIIAMDLENRHRKDISPYERGLSYARWLRSGQFASQEDIALALKVSASQVSRMLKLARLPTVVIDAFGNPIHICEGWGIGISQALEDPARRLATLRAAREIAAVTPRPSARDVYCHLMSASVEGRKPKIRVHDQVVTGHSGNPLFRIRHQRNSIALLLPIRKTSAKRLEEIQRALVEVFESSPVGELAAESDARKLRSVPSSQTS